jgi:BON domain
MSAGVVGIGVGGHILAGGGDAPYLQLPTNPTQTGQVGNRDDELAIRVQHAIANDAGLQSHRLNLLVNVLDGVAVIGGPIPTDGLQPTIDRVARSVNGIRNVKVSVWVQPNATVDPLVSRVGETLNPPKRRAEPSSHVPVPLSLPNEPAPAPAKQQPLPRMLLDPVVSTTAARNQSDATVPGAAPAPYPNIPPTNLPTRPVPEDKAWSALPARDEPIDALDDVVQHLRRNAKFTHLTVGLKNGTATVGGYAKSRSDVWEFGAALRDVPSVRRVVVGPVGLR